MSQGISLLLICICSSPSHETPHNFHICCQSNHQDLLIYAGQNTCSHRHQKKTNQVIYRCRQPSERGIYDTRKDKKRHRIRRQRSSARSGLTALCTRRRRYVATGGINDSCLYTAHSTKKSSQIIALHAGKKNIKAD